MLGALADIFGISVSSSLGYLLPAIIGLESMGIPSPGETALVLAAILASQGKLQIWLVILIGVTSAIAGDNLGYYLGRRFGREFVIKRGPLWHHRIQAVRAGDRFFARHGPKAVFLARWIALVRFAAAWLAGINRMRFRLFFFWNALGGITWGITYGLVGYFAGEAGAGVLARFGLAGAILLVVLFIGVFVFGYLRQRRQEEELALPDSGADASGADASPADASPADASPADASRADASPPARDQEEAGSS